MRSLALFSFSLFPRNLRESCISSIILFHIISEDSAKINHFFKGENAVRSCGKSHARKVRKKNEISNGCYCFPTGGKVNILIILDTSEGKTEAGPQMSHCG